VGESVAVAGGGDDVGVVAEPVEQRDCGGLVVCRVRICCSGSGLSPEGDRPVARPSKKANEDRVCIVLAVLRGDSTAAEAGRKNGVSEQSIHNWKRLFLESGRAGLE
jgi:hypothetical protein